MRKTTLLLLALFVTLTFPAFDGVLAKTDDKNASNVKSIVTDIDGQHNKVLVNTIDALNSSSGRNNLDYIAASKRRGGNSYGQMQDSTEPKINEVENASKIGKTQSDFLKSKLEAVACLICGKIEWVIPDTSRPLPK